MADGTVRVVDVYLRKAASTSYELERPVASPHVLSPRKQTILRAVLVNQPWRTVPADRQFAADAFLEEDEPVGLLLAQHVGLLPPRFQRALASGATPLPLRLARVAHYFGDAFGTRARRQAGACLGSQLTLAGWRGYHDAAVAGRDGPVAACVVQLRAGAARQRHGERLRQAGQRHRRDPARPALIWPAVRLL